MKSLTFAFIALAIFLAILAISIWLRLGAISLGFFDLFLMAIVASVFILFIHFTKKGNENV